MYPSYVSPPNDEFDHGQVYLEQFTFFQTVNNFICKLFYSFLCSARLFSISTVIPKHSDTCWQEWFQKYLHLLRPVALWVQQSMYRQNILSSIYTHIFCSQIETFSSASDRTYEILFGNQISCKSCCPLSQ